MTLTVVVGAEQIRLATVTFDAETGLYETFIGLPMAGNQLGRIDDHRLRPARSVAAACLTWAVSGYSTPSEVHRAAASGTLPVTGIT